ncbi:nisin-resistance protein [Corynebacterium kutscheri]|nr:nisin-resistance protein [Corynebacterium kutscheri]
MKTRKSKWKLGCGAVFAVIAVALTTVSYIYGPATVAVFTGKPFYLIKPSPTKYGKDVISIVEALGLYADSPEFSEAKTHALEQIKKANSYEETYEPLRELVKAAGGKHSNILAPDNSTDAPNESRSPSVHANKGIAIATVPDISREEDIQSYADTLTQGLIKHARCGAIVDLRGNGGGDMGPMVAGLSPLLPDGEVLSFVSRQSTSPVIVEGNSVTGGGTALSTQGGKLDIPVAVLVDDQTASSGEATMLAFRGLENSRSFGQPTAGYASGNVVIDLYDGATLMITFSKDKARTGEEFSEDPIEPDVRSDSAEQDAIAWLADKGCS